MRKGIVMPGGALRDKAACAEYRRGSPVRDGTPPLSPHEARRRESEPRVGWPFGHVEIDSTIFEQIACWTAMESVALELHGSGNHLERFGLGNFSLNVLHALSSTRSFHTELSGYAARTRTGFARD